MMDTENPTPTSPRAPLGLMIGGAALLFVVLFGGGYLTIRDGMTSSRPAPGGAEEQDWPPDSQIDDDYAKWQKPLVAIVVSGQMHGYTDPCGCTKPQYGGLTRRYNFIQSLKEKKWDVVGIDLGELPSPARHFDITRDPDAELRTIAPRPPFGLLAAESGVVGDSQGLVQRTLVITAVVVGARDRGQRELFGLDEVLAA